MERYFITFRSVTFAQKGQRALESLGLSCRLQRAPAWMETRGCGYAIEVRDLPEAVGCLRKNGAAFQRIYRLRGDSRPEVVDL